MSLDPVEDRPGGALLPPAFAGWFRARGWAPHAHQLAMLRAAAEGRHALLIVPTGGGKTLAGFLPSLVELGERPRPGLHTLYISPLKALAVDIHRNLELPIAEMRLPVKAESRTGDTPAAKRKRQVSNPPHMLMTTPESLALMIASPDARTLFGGLACIVIDELHALTDNKRGELLALALARLARLAPAARRVGLSATVAWPEALHAYLSPEADPHDARVERITGGERLPAQVDILESRVHLPWSGHYALHAVPEVYERLKGIGTAIVFVNTRAQAELVFQELWRLNEEGLAIALHHGSLSREQRRKVEAAMAAGKLRAVVATSSLDLGVDWAAVDLVVQIGAPKGASRLTQRIGRSNHRFDEPSRALLVPSSRFEVMECLAARDAVSQGTLDGDPPGPGRLDVLAQHLLGMACAGGFTAEEMFAEVRRAAPYAALPREDFDDVLTYVATGGYALRAYEKYRRLKQDAEGRWTVADGRVSRQYRMNVGTIVEAPMLTVRLGRRALGQVEEMFVQGMVRGDTFFFAGQLLTFQRIRENTLEVTSGGRGEARVPIYGGSRFPFTTHVAQRVRDMLQRPESWDRLPDQVRDWLRLQRLRSVLPDADGLLVETFPRGGKVYMVAYGFAGYNAHQTLGMLLTRRMERAGLDPIGFLANDYAIVVWGLKPPRRIAALFDEDMLGDDLEAWMDESTMLRRTFRNVAIIAGLIERRHPGLEKTGRQVTFSADLIYDVLREHEPNHVLLRATRQDAARGLTDIGRLGELLRRVKGKITHRRLDRASPLAVPILIQIGKEQVLGGGAMDSLLGEAEAAIVREAVPELAPPERAEEPADGQVGLPL